jgi:hypothetical protein
VEVESNHCEKTLTIKRYEQVTYEVVNANDEALDVSVQSLTYDSARRASTRLRRNAAFA